MARGGRDYGLPDADFFVVETNLSDVVASNQGFARLDNRGRVIWSEDFRNGLARWNATKNGTGSIPVWKYLDQRAIGYNGSILFDPLVNGGISMLVNYMGLPVSKRLGIEFSIYTETNFGEIEVELQHVFSGGTAKGAKVDVIPDTGVIRVIGSVSSPTIYTITNQSLFNGRWTSIKLVADYEAGEYIRLLLGNTQYDLSGVALRTGNSGLTGFTEILIRNTGYNATRIEPFYIGYIIISGDEP